MGTQGLPKKNPSLFGPAVLTEKGSLQTNTQTDTHDKYIYMYFISFTSLFWFLTGQ